MSDTIIASNVDELTAELPEGMDAVCAAAGEPLEIAAALESRGVSSRVARDRFGEQDVFTFAERLFRDYRPEPPASQGRKARRAGSTKELLRGAMFAAPGLMFAAALQSLHLQLPSWTVLLALTSGWAFSQSVAALGSAIAGRSATLGSIAKWWLLAATASTAGVAVAGEQIASGNWQTIAIACTVAAYVVACSLLLLAERIWAMATPLIPATALAVAGLIAGPTLLPTGVLAGLISLAIAATVLSVFRIPDFGNSHRPKLTRDDRLVAARFFCYGLLCGLMTSTIISLGEGVRSHDVIPLTAYPILISLGVMEWQLYSFLARIQKVLRTSVSTRSFARRAAGAFGLSLFLYLATLVGVCVVIGVVLFWRTQATPFALLAAEVSLGALFFVGLVASSCGRIGAVVIAGFLGMAIYLALIFGLRTSSLHAHVAAISCVCALTVSFVLSVVLTQRSIRSAFSYP